MIDGRRRIGDEAHIFPFVSIGLPPGLKFAGGGETVIGSRTAFASSSPSILWHYRWRRTAKIGDDRFLMAQAPRRARLFDWQSGHYG
jgi:acyl-[acyl carrier protein]--UDP-N-acetylglucosamine O-acyltransferase